jgi:hypothetical protein
MLVNAVYGIQLTIIAIKKVAGNISIKQTVQLLIVSGIQTVIIATMKDAGNTTPMKHALTQRIR